MDIQKMMVVGSGFMGAGIAQVARQAGYDVVLNDTSQELAGRGVMTVANNLGRLIARGKLDEEKEMLLILAIDAIGFD